MVYLNVGILFKITFIGLFSAFTTASWVKRTLVNITCNEPLDYYPFIISINKLWLKL